MQCNASVSGLSLLGGLHWLSIRQSLHVSQSSVTACGLLKDSTSSLISASPSSAEASKSRSEHDQMHRVGSRKRLVLETACSDPPTDAQCNCNAHACTFLYKFCGHCGGGAARSHDSMWWAWFIGCIRYSWLRTLNSKVKEITIMCSYLFHFLQFTGKLFLVITQFS